MLFSDSLTIMYSCHTLISKRSTYSITEIHFIAAKNSLISTLRGFLLLCIIYPNCWQFDMLNIYEHFDWQNCFQGWSRSSSKCCPERPGWSSVRIPAQSWMTWPMRSSRCCWARSAGCPRWSARLSSPACWLPGTAARAVPAWTWPGCTVRSVRSDQREQSN